MNSSLFVLHSSLTNMTEKQQKNAAAAFVFIGNKFLKNLPKRE